jgi:MFS family permease
VKRIHIAAAPADATPVQRKNFLNVQIDAIGIGLVNAASPFLPVLLTRLGATNTQVGLLTSMPGLTGLIMAVPIGQFLQKRRNIVPWFSITRLMVVSAYAATGLAPFFVPRQYLVPVILLIWALATIPQTALAVCFSVVMNAVAGPTYRYELMSRRWSILGITTAITVLLAGQVLVLISTPLNYQVVFITLSLGGVISFYFSRRIRLSDSTPLPSLPTHSWVERARNYGSLIMGQPDFVRFSIKRIVYLSGAVLVIPIFPLYYVQEVHATDAWIGIFSTAQTVVLVIGYFFWTRASRLRGSRFVLLWTTLGLALYPALVAMTHNLAVIAVLSGVAGIFQAGIDLVFFDELMKTVPAEYSATFVSLAQSTYYAVAVLAPLIGTQLSNSIGLGGVLMLSAGVRFAGFLLFALWNPKVARAV